MSVQLDPVELGFRRPFTQEVTETLRLRNPNTDPIAFKVKTTAPKQYCVRPNSGRIDPGEVVEVQVLLQAMKEDPPLEAKCRDKFLVQSVAVPANQEFSNVASIWSAVEQTAKSPVQEKKIRVTFLPAHGGAGVGAASTPSRHSLGTGDHDEPPAYSSPMSNAATPAAARSAPGARSEGSASTASAYAGAAAGAVGGAATAVANSVPTSTEELKEQLAAAQAKISQLTSQAQESTGLRQRKVGDSSAKDVTASSQSLGMQQAPPSGVPVPIVAALCLLCFLIAYLLF